MDFRERCQSALRNYEEFELNSNDYRLLENAIFSMDTMPERLALHQLGHPQLSRKALNEEAQKMRGQQKARLSHCRHTPLKVWQYHPD